MRDIGNLREIPMMDFAERICTFGDFYQKFEAFFSRGSDLTTTNVCELVS